MPLERVEGIPAITLEGVAFGMRDVDDYDFALLRNGIDP
jgi:hypothetical protein